MRRNVRAKVFKRILIGLLTLFFLYSLYVVKTVKGIDIDPKLSAPKAFHYIPNFIKSIQDSRSSRSPRAESNNLAQNLPNINN